MARSKEGSSVESQYASGYGRTDVEWNSSGRLCVCVKRTRMALGALRKLQSSSYTQCAAVRTGVATYPRAGTSTRVVVARIRIEEVQVGHHSDKATVCRRFLGFSAVDEGC